jgi:hypothetical protein
MEADMKEVLRRLEQLEGKYPESELERARAEGICLGLKMAKCHITQNSERVWTLIKKACIKGGLVRPDWGNVRGEGCGLYGSGMDEKIFFALHGLARSISDLLVTRIKIRMQAYKLITRSPHVLAEMVKPLDDSGQGEEGEG